MKKWMSLLRRLALPIFLFAGFSPASAQVQTQQMFVPGLRDTVEIVKDHWGISHIYARHQADLFFAQGFNAARDRLFQFELWRRRALGLLAEIQGKKALNHDIGARLLRLRQDIHQEMAHYHPDGVEIITAFVRGVNAYIDLTRDRPELLPIEFKLLGIRPEHWTPEVVVSRHNGLYNNAGTEVALAQAVQAIGSRRVRSLLQFQPANADLEIKDGLDAKLLTDEILTTYRASRRPPAFQPDDIVDARYRNPRAGTGLFEALLPHNTALDDPLNSLGSNNWVLSGRKTTSGFPIMANDPHRRQQIPSLRYWVHLVAPGWDVIGGGEPTLPGISIGHNQRGAWGLTIFRTDQEDIYVYDTNPANPDQYRYRNEWLDMKLIRERIPVRGQEPVDVVLKFTRHGPVLFEDKAHHKAYGLRAAWLEIGTAPYLASLRMDQAENWREFREACSYSGTPPENMVWADVEGNIGWQAVGFAPLRAGWQGLLPVPGDGRFEWKGFLPIKSLPHLANPPEDYLATANQYNVPAGYPYVVGLLWSDPFRHNRIREVLGSGRILSMMDNMQLQQDVLSLPARSLVPLLRTVQPRRRETARAVSLLLAWNGRLEASSAAAAIYAAWERQIIAKMRDLYVPAVARSYLPRLPLLRIISWLLAPDQHFGPDPLAGRSTFLLQCLETALSEVRSRLGDDMRKWRYGSEKYHHMKYNHGLSAAVNEAMRRQLDTRVLPRGGNGYTVNNTSNRDNQASGASFRIIADLGDWDNSVGTNTPGQSGVPGDKHYADLFPIWANGAYFPAFYSRAKVDGVAELVLRLQPPVRE